ncbi:MAG: cytochrome c oxidase accessory protein CcoG [Gemmatimonadota bacterium]
MLGFSHTREWVYPQSIQGRFMTLRRWTFAGLHLLLFVAPWITVSGYPLLRIDIPARRVFLFGQIFTPYDTIFLLLLLLFLAFSLFFFTAIFGRIWCGYACPQTVFLETWIRPIELWIEGDRTTRKRRDAQGLSFDLAWRKLLKWTLFAAVSFLIAMALVSLFAGARELWTGRAGPVAYAFVGVVTVAWFWDFTWFREQFCSYLCPYARFQSALADEESLIVTYDEGRGEPREKGKLAATEGRCIDCNKCVVVCPQGIDIRNGFQLECIQCARCIDACTTVMEPLGHETLVAYGSVAESQGRIVRRWRPRTFVYAGLLAALVVAGGTLMVRRVPFEAAVNRAPGSLFAVDPDGFVRNTFLLEVTNKDPRPGAVQYQVALEGVDGAEMLAPPLELGASESRTLPLVVRIPANAATARSLPLRVRVSSDRDEVVLPTTFLTGGAIHGGAAR